MSATLDPARVEEEALRLLAAHRAGSPAALDELFALLYDELRLMAQAHVRGERADPLLAPTALVHDVFLRLRDAALDCEDRDAFLRVAAAVMRRLLVDDARRRLASRRAHDVARERAHDAADERDRGVVDLDAALGRLEASRPELARVVELRFLVGLDVEATAGVLGVGTATVKRRWREARERLAEDVERDRDGTTQPDR